MTDIKPEPLWPVFSGEGGVNPWNIDAPAFLKLMTAYTGFWCTDFSVKYLNIRIDSRNNRFLILDEDSHQRMSADVVLTAIGKWRRKPITREEITALLNPPMREFSAALRAEIEERPAITAGLTEEQKAEQAKRCPCRGADDLCPCQNVSDAQARSAVITAARKVDAELANYRGWTCMKELHTSIVALNDVEKQT